MVVATRTARQFGLAVLGDVLPRPTFPDGYPPRGWFHAVLRRDPCAYCGGPAGGTVDHISPRLRSPRNRAHGANTAENLCGSCSACNQAKADRPLIAFLIERMEEAR